MKFETALKKDLPALVEMVRGEFPAASVDRGMLLKRLLGKNVFLMKLSEGNEIAGFTDLEIVSEEEAAIVLFLIKKSARGRSLGKALLDETIGFLAEKGVELVSVIVESENEKAKELYHEAGFRFAGLFVDALGQKTVERMELELDGERPSYVS